jgi:primosomal protein N' (replication factor Y)
VLVQTMQPAAPSLRHAATHDAAGFLEGELGRRRRLRYPPFSHLIEVGLAGPDEPALDQAAELLGAALAERLPAGAELLGPAPQFRLRGRHRRRLIIKAPERAPAVDAVRESVNGATRRLPKGVSLSVDVDPQ